MLTKTASLYDQFMATRKRTEEICAPLEIEDFVLQPVTFVSPPKWHLGHTSWFFEEFVLKEHQSGYKLFDDKFSYVFNSYYESVGDKVMRTDRGNLSRPTVQKINAYRKHVTQALGDFLQTDIPEDLKKIIEIGIHHEKQHQELLLTDIKYILGNNPLLPVYDKDFEENPVENFDREWLTISEGVYEIGLEHGGPGFRYDNEMGRHKTYLNEFFISNRLATNQEYLEFMEAGGYENVLLWHSDAWDWLNQTGTKAPLYWHKIEDDWCQYTLAGLKKINPNAPVTHVSYYEAFAFAQWKKMRLPTEAEWEIAQSEFKWGTRWEFTESAYLPYPGYQKPEGAIGEYNGKFMVNQKVLRGGSIATAKNHTRPTYRNFFHPPLRWQFNGIRLAK